MNLPSRHDEAKRKKPFAQVEKFNEQLIENGIFAPSTLKNSHYATTSTFAIHSFCRGIGVCVCVRVCLHYSNWIRSQTSASALKVKVYIPQKFVWTETDFFSLIRLHNGMWLQELMLTTVWSQQLFFFFIIIIIIIICLVFFHFGVVFNVLSRQILANH